MGLNTKIFSREGDDCYISSASFVDVNNVSAKHYGPTLSRSFRVCMAWLEQEVVGKRNGTLVEGSLIVNTLSMYLQNYKRFIISIC